MPLTNQIQKRLEIYNDLLIYIHMSVYSIQTFFFSIFQEKVRKSSYAESYIISDDEDSVQENPRNDKEIDELCLSNHKSYKFL